MGTQEGDEEVRPSELVANAADVVDPVKDTFTPEQVDRIGEDAALGLLFAPGSLVGKLQEANLPGQLATQLLKTLREMSPEALAKFASDVDGNLDQIVEFVIRGALHSVTSHGQIAQADVTREQVRRAFGNLDVSGVPYQC